MGFIIPLPLEIVEKIFEILKNLVGQINGMNQFELTKFIFLNNVQGSFYGLIFGILFGVFSVFMAAVNGFLLGFVVLMSIKSAGILSILKIFPHGIFELPAVFISLGMGLRLGTFIFREKNFDLFKDSLLNSLRVFLFVVIPLLIIAAIIESALIIILG